MIVPKILMVFMLGSLAAAVDEMSEIRITPTYDVMQETGDNQVLTCFFTKEDISNVKWFGPDFAEITGSTDKRSLDEEEGLLILTVNDLTFEDEGNYYCEGFSASANRTVRESRQISVYEPIAIIDTPTIQEFNIEEDVTVVCKVKGHPKPSVFWLQETGKVDLDVNGKYFMEEGSYNLNIRNISKEDEGNYICKARELDRGQNKEQSIQVIVMIPPKIENFVTEYTVTEGQQSVLPCEASGDPEPSYSWYKGDGSNIDETTFISSGNALELNVSRDLNDQSYTCVANNKAGSDRATLSLIVNVKPYFTDTAGDKTQEGNQALLRCVAEGVPTPTVHMYRDDMMLMETMVELDDDSAPLEENSTKPDGRWSANRVVVYNGNEAYVNFSYTNYIDAGKYECRAQNDAGLVTEAVFLTVEYGPRPTTLHNVWACNGTLATLECEFDANPAPTLAWGRYLPAEGSNDLDNDTSNFVLYDVSTLPDGIAVAQVGNVLTLAINTSVVENAFGTYYCSAENPIDTNSAPVELIKAGMPDAPIGVQATDIGTKTATISFTPLEPLVKYRYFTVRLVPASQDAESFNINLHAELNEYTFRDLTHNMQYTVIVEAVNCADTSLPSDPITFTTNAIEKAESVDIISGKASDEHDKYTVQWKTGSIGGGEISKILVALYKVENEIDGKNLTKLDEFTVQPGDLDEENGSYTIEGLDPASQYEIAVNIFNEVGSAESRRIFMTAMKPIVTTASNENGGSEFAVGSVDAKLIGIIVAVLLVLLIVIDITCFFTRSWGLTYWIYIHTCGKSKKHKVNDAEEGSAEFRQEAEGKYNVKEES